MKQLLIFILFTILLFSCKKEERYNPDQHITYAHWYKLSGSADTLFSVYIPSAFTPNGDGINDYFYPEGNFSLSHFRIYDRTGGIIFETTDINKNWDGSIGNNNKIHGQGAYVFQLIVTDINTSSYEYRGSVMLYR